MVYNGYDNCGCCQPCRITPLDSQTSRPVLSQNRQSGSQQRRRKLSQERRNGTARQYFDFYDGEQSTEPLRSLHQLHNYQLVPHRPAQRENCKGVGNDSSEDCHHLYVIPHLRAPQDNQELMCNSTDYDDSCNLQESLEAYDPDTNDAPGPYRYCRAGRDRWLEYPPQIHSPRPVGEANDIPCTPSPRMIDCHGRQLKLTTLSNSSCEDPCNARHQDPGNCQDWVDPRLNVSSAQHGHRSRGSYLRLLNSPQISPPVMVGRANTSQSCSSSLRQCNWYGCPQPVSISNKKCRWGGCHGPITTRCLEDTNKKHMFMKGCEVWHCGGCCKMERDHAVCETEALLKASCAALRKVNDNKPPSRSYPSDSERLQNTAFQSEINYSSGSHDETHWEDDDQRGAYQTSRNCESSSTAPMVSVTLESYDNFLRYKNAPRLCVCKNRECTKKSGKCTGRDSKEPPCLLDEFFKRLKWEKFKEKKFPRKQQRKPKILKIPVVL